LNLIAILLAWRIVIRFDFVNTTDRLRLLDHGNF
jgi:hypothetical protein